MLLKNIILASSSLYRKQLFDTFKIAYDVIPADIDETPLVGETAFNLVKRLSKEKALKVAESNPNSVIIGADLVAELNGKIYGKPYNYENALKFFKDFSGQKVTYYGGMCVLDTTSSKVIEHVDEMYAYYNKYTENELKSFLNLANNFHCSGGLDYEGLGGIMLNKLENDDPSAIKGLPLIKLAHILIEFGAINPFFKKSSSLCETN